MEKEKLGICDIILALIQTEPEITFPGLWNYRSQLHFLCTWTALDGFSFFVMQRIQTNAEFSQSVVSSLSYDTSVSGAGPPVLSLCFQ